MVDVQTVSVVVASTGLLIAATYYVLQIRNQTRLRQTDLVMRLYATFGSKEYQDAWQRIERSEFKDYNEYAQKYSIVDYIQCGVFWEGIGVLLRKKIIDVNLVDVLFSAPLKFMYERMKPLIESNREQFHDPRIFENFEYLNDEMKKRGPNGVRNG